MALRFFRRRRKFIRCPSCGSKIFADRKFCPGCGLKLEHKKKKWKRRSIVIVSALGVLLLAGVIFGARYIIIKRNEISFEVHKKVNSRLSAVTSKDTFLKKSYTDRAKLVETRLSRLKEEGYVESYSFVKDSLMYEFTYSDGALGAVMTTEFDGDLCGIDKGYASREEDGSLSINSRLDISSLGYKYQNEDINCAVLGFYNDRYLSEWVKKRSQIWSKNGLKTSLSVSCTAKELTDSLKGKDLVMLDAHGLTYSGTPALSFGERVTDDNLMIYSHDLKKGNMAELIAAGEMYYMILPSYFTEHCSEGAIKGAVIYISSCRSADSGELTRAFSDLGASAVTAVRGDMYSLYNAELEDAFVYSLLCGDTVSEALDYAKSVYGADDLEWSREFDGTPAAGKKTEPASPAVISGGDSTLVTLESK